MELKKTIIRKLTEKQIKRMSRFIVIIDKYFLEVENGENVYQVTYDKYLLGNYNLIANRLIKNKYSDGEEFALINKALINPLNEEYLEYRTYVEECKIKAKEYIEERDSILKTRKSQ